MGYAPGLTPQAIGLFGLTGFYHVLIWLGALAVGLLARLYPVLKLCCLVYSLSITGPISQEKERMRRRRQEKLSATWPVWHTRVNKNQARSSKPQARR